MGILKRKKLVLGIIIGLVVGSILGVCAYNIYADNVAYDNTVSGLTSNTVDGALNELYNKVKKLECKKGFAKYYDTETGGYGCQKGPGSINFATASWDEILAADLEQFQMSLDKGTKRKIQLDLDNDGLPETAAYLRIVNNSKPAECSNANFSQTACGLVIEFANIITNHRMNPYVEGVTTIGNGNIGGWESSEMRTFLNDETIGAASIYNSLPEELRSRIIPTKVVSGHGSTTGETNFITTDKLYLLSTKEVGFDSTTDTAKNETRILDYYNKYNTNASRIKDDNTTWWLRTADSSNTSKFSRVSTAGALNNYTSNTSTRTGVSPAFRVGYN